ncbi:PHP domain-containing protein [Candidatus Bathyarchaeota archaeon]|nr:MAG: PHP domain-containing protein [Candidatus Bathyarchaeota archaeon]TMI58212.1 MAG: PHP domain-containing protein [Candidatus Bathyarchaeota archaeon]
MKWETHCHTVYSNRRHRRFDALNTPREMIEAAIRKGLQGMIITDHDSVAGGLAGRKAARRYKEFKVIPGAEVTSRSGHILAVGIENNVPRSLTVEETVERIHDLGGIAVASHPFSSRVRPSLGEECLKTDGVEVFNATNRGDSNSRALFLAQTHGRRGTAGSDAHWHRTVGNAGIVCEDPLEDIPHGRARLFGEYTSTWNMTVFNFRQLASALANRPLWK